MDLSFPKSCRRLFTLLLLLVLLPDLHAQGRWTEAQANAWYARQPWPVGANFLPSTAINELEMWQAESFDPVTIDRELAWAEGIGLTFWSSRPSGSTTSSTPTARPIASGKPSLSAA
ncbi:MAG: hypothetical protein WBM14_04860 [Terracidiphilus sp.]